MSCFVIGMAIRAEIVPEYCIALSKCKKITSKINFGNFVCLSGEIGLCLRILSKKLLSIDLTAFGAKPLTTSTFTVNRYETAS